MKSYNDTTYAVLGILTTSCRSGYAIKQLIDQSLNHFWKISYGQLYPALQFIVDEGLAEVRVVREAGKLEKKEYYLTPKGTEALQNWLEQPVKQIPTERNEILLKLFFGRYQSRTSQIQLLQHYEHELKLRHQVYLAIEQSINSHDNNSEDSLYWLLTLDYGKRTTSAAIEWCEAALVTIAARGESL